MGRMSVDLGLTLAALWALGCAAPREADVATSEPPQNQVIQVGRRDAGVRSDPSPGAVTRAPSPCASLFDATRLATAEVELSASDLARLNDEFLHPRPDDDGSGLFKSWYPVVFKLGGEVRADAMIRLKGDWSWRQTVAEDARPKAQFVIAFDRKDPAGRFQGVSRLELDMVRDDPTYLRERVGQHALRALGLPAVCATSMRLKLNGSYHGLYTAMEELNPELLPRLFPGASGGALWKHGTQIETEGTPAVYARQEAWKAAKNAAAMTRIIDIDQALSVWAAEIVLNNADGYYGGEHNFYTYDHPSRGFQWLSTDLDSTFDYLDWDIHPIYWWEQHDPDQTAGHHFRAVMLDRGLRARLVDAVERTIARWDAPALQARVDAWALQIADSVRDDPHRIETLERVAEATSWLRDTVHHRPEWLKPWITCERTGQGTDADRDGVPWCRDCNDQRAAQRPGAAEVCGNGVDDNCDGLKDEDCGPGSPRSDGSPWDRASW